MDTKTGTLIYELKGRMEKMTGDERIDVMRSIMRGFCLECGRACPEGCCQCWNDE